MVNGLVDFCLIGSAFTLPLIHTHTHTPDTPGPTWGLVSCPTTFRHMTRGPGNQTTDPPIGRRLLDLLIYSRRNNVEMIM